MIPLASHRRLWSFLGLCSFGKERSKWIQTASLIFTISLFLGIVCVVLASVAFCIKYLSTDVEGSLHALFQITAFTAITYASVVAFVERPKIAAICDRLTQIYDNCKIV